MRLAGKIADFRVYGIIEWNLATDKLNLTIKEKIQMHNSFYIDNPVWDFIGKIMDFIWLSILWFVCCIPVITIGASTTALYTIMLQIARKQQGSITKDFFNAFKKNFRQGTILWFFAALIGGILYINFRFYTQRADNFSQMFSIIIAILIFVFLLALQYIFPVLAQFNNSIKNVILMAFVMSIKNFGWSILLLLITISIIALSFSAIKILFIFAAGLITFLHSEILVRIFNGYIRQQKSMERQ
jgi:uncharacterized membrane protein YesL